MWCSPYGETRSRNLAFLQGPHEWSVRWLTQCVDLMTNADRGIEVDRRGRERPSGGSCGRDVPGANQSTM